MSEAFIAAIESAREVRRNGAFAGMNQAADVLAAQFKNELQPIVTALEVIEGIDSAREAMDAIERIGLLCAALRGER